MGYETTPRDVQVTLTGEIVRFPSLTVRKAVVLNTSASVNVVIGVYDQSYYSKVLFPGQSYTLEPPASFRFDLANFAADLESKPGSAILDIFCWL